MDLREIRLKFLSMSGRFDLVTSTGADLGANFYINAGQRLLDRLLPFPKAKARQFIKPAKGVDYLTLTDCRAVLEVWGRNSTSSWQLKKRYLQDLKNFATQTTTLTTSLYYALNINRPYPDSDDGTSYPGESGGDSDIVYGNGNFAKSGIKLFPATDGNTTYEVFGLWYSPELTSDSSTSFWSVEHPDILLLAALCSVETFNRNFSGVREYLATLRELVTQISFDEIEEEISERNRIDG